MLSETPELQLLETTEGEEGVLIGVRNDLLSKSSRLVLRAREWTTGEAAEDAGEWLGDVLQILAH